MAKLKLSSPWVEYYHAVNAFFKEDSSVHVIFDEENSEINMFVDNDRKAAALDRLMPKEKQFGNVTLHITVYPSNYFRNQKYDLAHAAFDGNGALSFIRTVEGVMSNNITYVVFKNKVVQYFNDDLGDINGQCSTLYQDIAKKIFNEIDGVFYCTDLPCNSVTLLTGSTVSR